MHGFDYLVPHFITRVRGTHIVVTLDLISEVLHEPSIEFATTPNYEHLRNVSNGELSSRFCETPSLGDRQNTPCSGFAKGLRFLNMVMTFFLGFTYLTIYAHALHYICIFTMFHAL